MPLLVSLTGSLVGCPPARSYDFQDEQDANRRVTGTSRKAYVVQDFDAAPVEVTFGDESAPAFEQVRALGFGAPVTMNVEAGRRVKFVSLVQEKATARS